LLPVLGAARSAAVLPPPGYAAIEAADPATIVDSAMRGDRAAFGCLFERYASMVHGILLTKVPPVEADDLMQDVFVTALQKLGSLKETHAFGGWLAAIARNRALDFHRNRRDTTELSEDLAQSDADRSQAEQVLAAIRLLPEAYREPLVLRLVEGMTGPEIADQVGLTPDSVRVNLHRGMKLLREKLGLAP
jgi:RNA polymerase sigma-70 factor (ECF subfamily)